MRVTVGTVVGLIPSGHANAEILAAYPYLDGEDIRQALAYAAWRVEELEVPLPAAYRSAWLRSSRSRKGYTAISAALYSK